MRLTATTSPIENLAGLDNAVRLIAEGDENEKVNSTEAFEMSTHMGQLANALQLTVDQYETVEMIQNQFVEDMKKAGKASDDERASLMRKAISHDLNYMHSILTTNQYRTYLAILNVTLQNRGLQMEIF